MGKRRKRVWVALGIGLLATLAVLEVLSLPAQLSRARYGRIKPGRSRGEIQAILGRPPDTDLTKPPHQFRHCLWLDSEALVQVSFDEQGTATDVGVNPRIQPAWYDVQLMRLGMTQSPPWLDSLNRLRWQLGW
jgi:hypothetical protein